MASQKTANFLNHCVFGHAGPIRAFAKTLGATGEYQSQCLLEQYLPPGYSKPIFPLNDNDVAGGPLVKGGYQAERHLAIGLLRVFDATLNSTQAGGEPVFDWHDKHGQYMRGVWTRVGAQQCMDHSALTSGQPALALCAPNTKHYSMQPIL